MFMWVTKVSELIGSSEQSFEDAACAVVVRANRTLSGITGVEVLAKTIKVNLGEIAEYRVRLRLSFDVAPHADQHW
jgi:flavin-binding protein dodecin